MQITELRLSTTRTFNLGNYESLRLEASATAQVDETDNRDLVREQLIAELRRGLEDQWKEFKPKAKTA